MAKHAPPPTKYGSPAIGQPKPSALPVQHRHQPPVTKFGPSLAVRPSGHAVQRMQQATLNTALSAEDVQFVHNSLASVANVYTYTFTFAKERSGNRACQSVAIGAVLNKNPETVFKELFHISNNINIKIDRGDETTVSEVKKVNTALSVFSFDMKDEAKDGYCDYDFASETVIVSYLIAHGFTDCTAGHKGKWAIRFRDEAAAGRYVVLTPGHAVAFIITGSSKARTVISVDADAGSQGGLAKSSEQKPILAVFKHA